MHLLVNRGWTQTPQAPTPQGEVRIEGIALERLPRLLQLTESAKGRVRQTLDIDEFAAEAGLRLQPIVIEQRSDTGDGLARDWPRPDAVIEKHEGYALQWYSLAALAVVLVIVLSFRRIEDPSK
jgi:cytochrome oxidase assembly protein ShyY1